MGRIVFVVEAPGQTGVCDRLITFLGFSTNALVIPPPPVGFPSPDALLGVRVLRPFLSFGVRHVISDVGESCDNSRGNSNVITKGVVGDSGWIVQARRHGNRHGGVRPSSVVARAGFRANLLHAAPYAPTFTLGLVGYWRR